LKEPIPVSILVLINEYIYFLKELEEKLKRQLLI
jgi:hypothetical protein